jgi:hypothetical protein
MTIRSGSASFIAQNGRVDGTCPRVTKRAGIHAGDGRFNLTVNGNTDLKGAVIGIRGGLPSRFVGITYDLLTATQTHRHVQPNQVAS